MSSHHFVKEGQEPALIIANGNACSYDLLTNIMEWCPFIVVLDGAYDRLLEMQIVPDVVIGDLDSLKAERNHQHIKFVQLESQETTDLEKAIDYLSESGYDEINVLWATGNRLDHTLNNVATLARYPKTRIVLYDDFSKCFLLPKSYKKHYDNGTALSLIPLPNAEGIVTSNMKYPLKNETLTYAKRSGTSNEVASDGIVEITYISGLLALIESRS